MLHRGLAVLLLTAALVPAARAAELDGTSWKMRLSGLPQALMFWRTDELRFDNGQFTSAECAPYGFKAGPYSGGGSWSAEQTNDKGETMSWKGTRSGDMMRGTFTWTKAGGKPKTYRWRARLISGAR